MNHDWKESLKQGFSSFEADELPDADGVWSAIESELDAREGATAPAGGEEPVIVAPRRVAVPWWRRSAAAAAVVLLLVAVGGGLAWWQFDGGDDKGQMAQSAKDDGVEAPHSEVIAAPHAADDDVVAASASAADVVAAPHSAYAAPASSHVARPVASSSHVAQSAADVVVAPHSTDALADNIADTSERNVNGAAAQEVPVRQSSASDESTKSTNAQPSTEPRKEAVPAYPQKRIVTPVKHRGQLANYSLYASVHGGTSSTVGGYHMLSPEARPASAESSVPYAAPYVRGYDDPLRAVQLYNLEDQPITSVEHRQPISIGGKLSFAFTSGRGGKDLGWSLGTGLYYTRLTTELTAGSSHTYYLNHQSIHYLGLPLEVSRTLFSLHSVSFSALAGVNAEFPLRGTMNVDTYIDHSIYSSKKQTLRDVPMQFSADAALSAEYRLRSRHRHGDWGIYAEPGIVYHFDDRSSMLTLYSERKLNFNVQMGVRFHFSR